MPLEIRTIPGLDGLFDPPGSDAAQLIVRREVLRKNWAKLRSQLSRGLGKPPAGISKALNDSALAAFQAFTDWNAGIGTLKEFGAAYEAEVAEQEAIYDMYSGKVARALEAVGKQPEFTTDIPRKDPVAPPPISQAGMPYSMPEPPRPATWDTVDWVLASLATLSLVYIVVSTTRGGPRWDDDDMPEVRPARGGRSYGARRKAEPELRFEPGPRDEDEDEAEVWAETPTSWSGRYRPPPRGTLVVE
jgi:hypothetical protein